MDIQTIINLIGYMGIGGIIVGYLQYRWNRKTELMKIHWTRFSEIELKTRTLNEDKYRSTLVFMRCVIKPENVNQFNIDDPNIQDMRNEKDIKKYVETKLIEFYYNSLLYASDEVLRKIKQFIDAPTESNFIQTAIAMRKDLWKKERTEINENEITLENFTL
ncbi:MAG: hypothetical protein PHR36_05050 [Patescibacteria group bacterium]|nr:hypothetical protein [Patescibacteria group bacterium]